MTFRQDENQFNKSNNFIPKFVYGTLNNFNFINSSLRQFESMNIDEPEMITTDSEYDNDDNDSLKNYKSSIKGSRSASRRRRKKSSGLSKKMKKWTAEEDQRLRKAVEKYGTNDWQKVAEEVGGKRKRAQCAQRWMRGLNPAISHEGWTPEEDEQLFRLVEEYGNKNWMKIASLMNNRCDVQCRYRFKKLRRCNVDLSTFEKQKEIQNQSNFSPFSNSNLSNGIGIIPTINVEAAAYLNKTLNLQVTRPKLPSITHLLEILDSPLGRPNYA